jgi:UPF0716 family protein affecting phage T7 exclusion
MKGQVPVALSDEERRRLEKLEQGLAAADPDLARQLAGGTHIRAPSGTLYGVLVIVAGFALIIAGIITKLTIIGAVGFLLMIAGGEWIFRGIRPPKGPTNLP